MVFGGDKVTAQTIRNVTDDPIHFTAATQGLVEAGGRSLELLYYSTECLAQEEEHCAEVRGARQIASRALWRSRGLPCARRESWWGAHS